MDKYDYDIMNIIHKLEKRNFGERFVIFICGILIYSISFSIFFSPKDIVTGGTTGIAIILENILHIDTSITVFVLSAILLVLGYFLLGRGMFFKTFFGVIVLPLFLKFGSFYAHLLSFESTSLFIMVFFGGIVMGFGNGLIIKSGFSVGGFQTLYQILYKYFGISIGKSTLVLNGILIFVSSFFFGLDKALYAVVGLYVCSFVTDKVMLEPSATKTFYIVTEKEEEISQCIVEDFGFGVTQISAKGGYSNDSKKVLMCAIPTRNYYHLKEVIEEIDQDVFFLITDTYEVYHNAG